MDRKLAQKLGFKEGQVQAVRLMLEDGATLPFIARYRKERTGSLDELALEKISDGLSQLQVLEARLNSMLKSLKERDLWTESLESNLRGAENLTDLEDLWLPHRVKRKTRASVARDLGLGPLAELFWSKKNIDESMREFLRDSSCSLEESWQGVKDIVAEKLSENGAVRQRLRELFVDRGEIHSTLVKKKESEASKFKDYFDFKEACSKMPSHRLLAILRGQNEGCLRVRCAPREAEALSSMEIVLWFRLPPKHHLNIWKEIMADAYSRLLQPSLETETIKELKQKADVEAVGVFAENLKELLMAAPLGQKEAIAIDPGFRTGCKAVCLGPQGQFLENNTLFPFASASQKSSAEDWLRSKVDEGCKVIAIGNGTAGRETEAFVKALGLECQVIMVSESGASIYSASAVARKEFPDLDLTVRGAISIGRRLQDPMAELVKLDPKSIGVGQYQHDVDQKFLTEKLDRVVESCVNGVGVELNSASSELLQRVSGLGPKLADAVVDYRKENGPFQKRKELLKVPRLGAKAFEQAAGFLRIRGGAHPLDASGVHPERYGLVEQIAKDLGVEVDQWLRNSSYGSKVNLQSYVTQDVGLPTLEDIMAEMGKPGRDPRPVFEAFAFEESVQSIEDLKEGMELPGLVTNVTKFGAFVDLGVHQDGLVHISQMADHFVKDPMEVVKVQQRVRVRVMEVDIKRKRIGLSMKGMN
jgi:uncharacterized protein